MTEHIRWKHSILSHLIGAQIPRLAMEPCPAGGGFQRRHPLSQQAQKDPGQHIPAAPGGHAGIAGGIAVAGLAVGNAGSVSLEQKDAVPVPGKGRRRFHAVLPHRAAQPGKLSVVGCQDGGILPSAQNILMPPQGGYAIGIHDHGTFCLLQHRRDHRLGIRADAQAAADKDGIHLFQPGEDLRQSLS